MYIKTRDGQVWAINPITEVKHHIDKAHWAVLVKFEHTVINATDAEAALFTTV